MKPLPNKPPMRILNRGLHYSFPYAVQKQRRFFGFKWWSTITCTRYFEIAENHIANFMTAQEYR